MKKILYISNIAGAKTSVNFFGTALSAAKKLGFEFFVVANRSASTKEQIALDEEKYGVHLLHADINRNPLSRSNIKAYKQIKEIIKKYDIDYIHCNTPIGGVLGRMAGKKCHIKRIIYQAHGFHFFDGAPKKNWLIYYNVEKMMAKYTDAIITINNEDYNRAQKFSLRGLGKVYYVPGVGIDLEKYSGDKNNREIKRQEMGIGDEVVFISMGDLIERKNYETAIRAISENREKNIKYWICGKGPLEKKLKDLAQELDVADKVNFLGYRTDIDELLNASDVFILSSYQEGLPRSTSEAMALGLPCLISKIRGNVDLIEDGKGGWLYNPNDCDGFARGISELSTNSKKRNDMRDYNLDRIKKFDVSTVAECITEIYKKEFTE